MSDCCCANTPIKTKQICPECGSTCKSVGMPTLYHQVRFPENQAIITDSYFFALPKHAQLGTFPVRVTSLFQNSISEAIEPFKTTRFVTVLILTPGSIY